MPPSPGDRVTLIKLVELIKENLGIDEGLKGARAVNDAISQLGIECEGSLKDKANSLAEEIGLEERA